MQKLRKRDNKWIKRILNQCVPKETIFHAKIKLIDGTKQEILSVLDNISHDTIYCSEGIFEITNIQSIRIVAAGELNKLLTDYRSAEYDLAWYARQGPFC